MARIAGSKRALDASTTEVEVDSSLASEVIRVTIVLRPKTPTPKTRRFPARPITRKQFSETYGANPAIVAQVKKFARLHKLTVVRSDVAQRVVELSGTVTAMASAFQVSVLRYQNADGQRFRAHNTDVHVPDEWAANVVAVLGLDNEPVFRPHIVFAKPATSRELIGSWAFAPIDVAKHYNFPTNTPQGRGYCIGIIELGGGFQDSDLKTFFKKRNLSVPSVAVVSVDGAMNNPNVNQNADGEVALDMQVAGSVAPQSTQAIYFAPNATASFFNAVNTAIHDTNNNPIVISISWGTREQNFAPADRDAMNQAFNDAVLLDITVFVASGDDGSNDNGTDGQAHVDFPSSSPHVVGCGGTSLGLFGEGAWSGSGGGVSDVFDVPDFQAGLNIPVSVNPNRRVGRGVPDVAGNADPGTGYDIVVGGADTTVGGTSAVAPLWAGLTAVLTSAAGRTLDFIGNAVYQNSKACRDITGGSNGGYNAGAGWDACTGLGCPDGAELTAMFAGKDVDRATAAFQANTGNLFTTVGIPETSTDTVLGMAAGTSPSCARLANGTLAIAFQANTGNLWVVTGNPPKGVDTLLGMAPGTSPSIAAVPGGGFVVAFQANTGNLGINRGKPQTWTDTLFGMMPGTNPSIAALTSTKLRVAFQANTGNLWVATGDPQGGGDTNLGMMNGTSPSIASLGSTDYAIAFQANTGNLFTFRAKTFTGTDTSLGMAAGTSPSVFGYASGEFAVAFQSNAGVLWLWTSKSNSGTETLLGMMQGTSPSITGTSAGGYVTGFQANTGVLWMTSGRPQTGVDTHQGMLRNSSPALA